MRRRRLNERCARLVKFGGGASVELTKVFRVLQAQMEAATAKMRGAYHEHKNGRATAGVVDGVQMAKRRKLNAMVGGSGVFRAFSLRLYTCSPCVRPAARPKTLFEKAKVNSRRIGQIYAPPRRTTRAPVVTNASSAFFPTSTSSSRTPSSTVAPASPSRKAAPPTKVITVARTVRLPLPTPPPPPIRPISSLPNRTRAPPSNASSSTSSRPSSLAGSMSPPPVPLLPPPPPPPPAKSPGYAPGAVRASPAALNSLFLKPKARPSQRK